MGRERKKSLYNHSISIFRVNFVVSGVVVAQGVDIWILEIKNLLDPIWNILRFFLKGNTFKPNESIKSANVDSKL